MKRWALIETGVVTTVTEQVSAPIIGGAWAECPGWVGPGDLYAAGVFTRAPTEPKAWSAFDFYRRFSSAERIAIRTLAQTDPIAADFMATLDATISSGSRVLANDPDLIAGLGYLQTKPVGSPVLSAARAAEMLA